MFIMDVPHVPAQQTSIVLAQAATPRAGANLQPDYILKTCQETEHATKALSGINPALGLASYLQHHGHKTIDLATIKITLLEGPAHGELAPGGFAYVYEPEPRYIGNDKAVFMAEFEGKVYKLVVELHVFAMVGENTCTPPRLFEINVKPVSGSSDYDLNSIPVTLFTLPGGTV